MKRFFLHMAMGMFTGALLWGWGLAGILMFLGFLAYEVVEDWRIRDRSYRDIFGFLWGFGGLVTLRIAWLWFRPPPVYF